MKVSIVFTLSVVPSIWWESNLAWQIEGPARITAMIATAVVLTALARRLRPDLSTIFTGNDAITRLTGTMLIASAVVPVASDAMASIGHTMKLYGPAAIAPIHIVIVTLAFAAMTLEVYAVVRRLDRDRREALTRLQSSEERLRLQIDHMPVASITCSLDLVITSWNPAAERIFGWSAHEMVGHSALDLIRASDAERVRRVRADVLAGTTVNVVQENCTKDGRTILCRWFCTAVRDAGGAVTSIIGMAQDITEDHRREAALARSEERYRQLVDNLPHYIYSVDNENRYTAMNRAAKDALGLDEESAIGRTPMEVGIPRELADDWMAQFARTRNAGTTQTTENSGPVRGTTCVVKTITAPIRDESGDVIGVTGISVDLTEQKNAEASQRQLMRAIEQLDEVMFTTDRDGAITYANPAFERVYGYPLPEVLGKTPRILKSGELPDAYYRRFWAELLSGHSTRIAYRNRRKDGGLVDVVGTASPLFGPDGGVCGFVAVQQDVTEQKRAAEENERLNDRITRVAKLEALGTLAGGIAHDFNNILTIVATHAVLLERCANDASTTARVIQTISQAVKRGASLSRQILTFARRADVNKEQVETSTLLMELASMLRETFPRTVQFGLDLDPSLPPIRADAGQLHQALLNVCVNARDAMPDGGQINVATRRAAARTLKAVFGGDASTDCVCISVTDTGTGMDDDTRRRVFEPFFTTKEKGQGTGLGLAVVYGIVQSHGGWIDVDSRVGNGTTVRLYFPIGTEDAKPHPSPSVPAAHGGHESIVVVDDERELLDAVAHHLANRGYVVRAAKDGPDALARCGEHVPDAMVMDLGMPAMSPIALIDKLQAIGTFPIIAMTGYVDPEMHAAVVRAGVSRIIQKPFDIDDLVTAVRAVLDEQSSVRHPLLSA
jgi:PAS domain S-box-containing protein